MGDQLHADLEKIREIGPGLRDLKNQYSRVTAVDASTFRSEAGAPVLANALTEFASDWNIRLRNLLADLDDLARLADTAAAVYAQADQDLGAALTRAWAPPPPAHGSRVRAIVD